MIDGGIMPKCQYCKDKGKCEFYMKSHTAGARYFSKFCEDGKNYAVEICRKNNEFK